MYCIESQGSKYTHVIEPVLILHKKIIRIIYGFPRLAHTKALLNFQNLNTCKKILLCSCLPNNNVPLKLGFVLCSTYA